MGATYYASHIIGDNYKRYFALIRTTIRGHFVYPSIYYIYICPPLLVFPVDKYDQKYQDVRNKLGRFGLEGHAHTIPIKDLSGGQKARVVFAGMLLRAS